MILLDLLFDQVTYPIKTQISKNYAMRVKKIMRKVRLSKNRKKSQTQLQTTKQN